MPDYSMDLNSMLSTPQTGNQDILHLNRFYPPKSVMSRLLEVINSLNKQSSVSQMTMMYANLAILATT